MEVGEWEGKEIYVCTDSAPSAALEKQKFLGAIGFFPPLNC